MTSLYSATEIDGRLFNEMLVNGLAYLSQNEKKVNDMNVFPVPDGDTGTNLRLTVFGGISHAMRTDNLGTYVKQISEGMLFGARGNSGVIVSQIFKGIADVLSPLDRMKTDDFITALISGYKTAYASLVNPVEGTVLTVAREGTEYFAKYAQSISCFGKLFDVYIDAMKKSLERTPDLLPRLKEADVTDSGAFGFILIFEGMAKYLNGEIIDSQPQKKESHDNQSVDFSVFSENSSFEYGYCMEFLLRLMSLKTDIQSFKRENFVAELEKLGESVVCVQDKTIVKVHVHTFKPSPIIDLAQQYGEFLTFKLENMSFQHNGEVVKQKKSAPKVHYPIAVVTPVCGHGIAEILKSFQYVRVIESDVSINTSAQEFVQSCTDLDADKIVIMPNNKNVYKSAMQAIELMGLQNVSVIPTTSVVQTYYALAMDGDASVQDRIRDMERNSLSVKTLTCARCTKNVKINGVECKIGHYVAYLDGEPFCCTPSVNESVVKSLLEIPEKSMIFAFLGRNFKESETFERELEENFSEIDCTVQYGLQDTFEVIIGIV